MSLCIFPFMTGPMIMAILDVEQRSSERLMKCRRKDLAAGTRPAPSMSE